MNMITGKVIFQLPSYLDASIRKMYQNSSKEPPVMVGPPSSTSNIARDPLMRPT
ncbi:hypothetical protein LguiA_017450 [Lonicera macranthoides]